MTRILAGAAGMLALRAAFVRAFTWKIRRDVARLNAGDVAPLLATFADDAVLAFADGDHRWAGVHRGRPAIERFLRSFVDAGLAGEIKAVWVAGPPWAMHVVARFDDRASGPDGRLLYENETCLVLRTRWGKVVEQTDYYLDTERIGAFDRALAALGR